MQREHGRLSSQRTLLSRQEVQTSVEYLARFFLRDVLRKDTTSA
jgi:hypothetical protein